MHNRHVHAQSNRIYSSFIQSHSCYNNLLYIFINNLLCWIFWEKEKMFLKKNGQEYTEEDLFLSWGFIKSTCCVILATVIFLLLLWFLSLFSPCFAYASYVIGSFLPAMASDSRLTDTHILKSHMCTLNDMTLCCCAAASCNCPHDEKKCIILKINKRRSNECWPPS